MRIPQKKEVTILSVTKHSVDKDTGLIHTNVTTAANQSDVSLMSELITGEEEEVFGDAGYLGAEKLDEAITHNSKGKKINDQ